MRGGGGGKMLCCGHNGWKARGHREINSTDTNHADLILKRVASPLTAAPEGRFHLLASAMDTHTHSYTGVTPTRGANVPH